jgi:hypothetical protein
MMMFRELVAERFDSRKHDSQNGLSLLRRGGRSRHSTLGLIFRTTTAE